MVDVLQRLPMTNRDVFSILKEKGYLEFGSTISGKILRQLCDIKEVKKGTKEEFDRMALAELGYVSYIRNMLLNEGKYFKGERSGYRILLPSENSEQVLSYMNSADNKLKRGLKLNKNTPTKYKINSNTEVRAMMKRESIKTHEI